MTTQLKFTDKQRHDILKEAENGVTVPELCRKYGIAKETFYKWRKAIIEQVVNETPDRTVEHKGKKLNEADLSEAELEHKVESIVDGRITPLEDMVAKIVEALRKQGIRVEPKVRRDE